MEVGVMSNNTQNSGSSSSSSPHSNSPQNWATTTEPLTYLQMNSSTPSVMTESVPGWYSVPMDTSMSGPKFLFPIIEQHYNGGSPTGSPIQLLTSAANAANGTDGGALLTFGSSPFTWNSDQHQQAQQEVAMNIMGHLDESGLQQFYRTASASSGVSGISTLSAADSLVTIASKDGSLYGLSADDMMGNGNADYGNALMGDVQSMYIGGVEDNDAFGSNVMIGGGQRMDAMPLEQLEQYPTDFNADFGNANSNSPFSVSGGSMDSNMSGSEPIKRSGSATKYFWQYNIQRKGPKVCLTPHKPDPFGPHTIDPHHLKKKADPVFNPEIVSQAEWKGIRVRHSGKARQGDGNDLTPDPRKLNRIGEELRKLNNTIYALDEDLEDPRKKNTARKVKNKLASRVCRLKKKAQHEANKIKLHGLEDQHRELLKALQLSRQAVVSKARLLLQGHNSHESCYQAIRIIEDKNLATRCQGRTAEFVEDQLSLAANAQKDPKKRGRA